MKFSVIIPLRSNSKGLKNKNMLNFSNNNNLTNFTLKKLIPIKEINKIYILTDSNSYKKKIIQNKKIDKSFIRKKKYSRTNSKIQDLINDFLLSFKKEYCPENILMLQVTSPMLKKKEILQTLNFIKKNKTKSLFHVTKVLEHPNEIILDKNLGWKYLVKKRITNRQNYFNKYYFITGSLFFFTKKFFFKYKQLFNKKSFAYEVDKINFIDIDNAFTFEMSQKLNTMKLRN